MKHAVIYTLFILTLTACSQDCAMTSKAQSQGNVPPECVIFFLKQQNKHAKVLNQKECSLQNVLKKEMKPLTNAMLY